MHGINFEVPHPMYGINFAGEDFLMTLRTYVISAVIGRES